jgi:hypothetical protein
LLIAGFLLPAAKLLLFSLSLDLLHLCLSRGLLLTGCGCLLLTFSLDCAPLLTELFPWVS